MRTATVVLSLCALAVGRVVHVAPEGTGDGSSWAQAKGSVRAGIPAFVNGDTFKDELWAR